MIEALSVERHTTGEDGQDIGWLVHVDETVKVWAGEISRDLFDRQELEVRDQMENDFGWFLVVYNTEGTVIARIADHYDALEIATIYAKGLLARTRSVEPPREMSALAIKFFRDTDAAFTTGADVQCLAGLFTAIRTQAIEMCAGVADKDGVHCPDESYEAACQNIAASIRGFL